MLINQNWSCPDDPGAQDGDDKENISQNQQKAGEWAKMPISQQDKEYIKANILDCLDVASTQLKNKKIA